MTETESKPVGNLLTDDEAAAAFGIDADILRAWLKRGAPISRRPARRGTRRLELQTLARWVFQRKSAGELCDDLLERAIVCTQREVADFFNLSPRTVKDWRQRGMPVVATGVDHNPFLYPLSRIFHWKAEINELNQQRETKPQASEDVYRAKLVAETKRIHVDRLHRRLKLEKMKAGLVFRSAAEAKVAEMCDRVRDRLQLIPAEIAGVVPPNLREELRDQSNHKIKLALKELDGFPWDEIQAATK